MHRHAKERTVTRSLLRLLLLLPLFAASAVLAALTEVNTFGSNPGKLRMFKDVPASVMQAAPLVVALHGCSQRASDYDTDTGWKELADRFHFILLLPEQRPENNERRCFNWFNGWAFSDFWSWSEWGSDQDRDEGEALSIKQMIDKMKADHPIDPKRIYVTGLSAGGAMTAVMLATYPEIFSGGAILAGVPYKCAQNVVEALAECGVDLNNAGQGRISNLSPATWASRVRAATDHKGPWPRVSIWQGDADKTVNPENARELLEQWTAVHGVDTVADTEERVKGQLHRVYRNAHGDPLVESYMVSSLGHGVPVDPGIGSDKCGHAAEHTFPVGICASYYIGKFWGLIP